MRMRLEAVDHVTISFSDELDLGREFVVDEEVAAVRASQYVLAVGAIVCNRLEPLK